MDVAAGLTQNTGLAGLLSKLCPRSGTYSTAIDGFWMIRSPVPVVPRTSLDQAVFCIVAQGAKSILLNGQRCVYDRNKYLLVSRDLPLVGQIEEASAAKPFLGASLVLDFDEIRSLMREAELPRVPVAAVQPSLVVEALDDQLLDAVTRLARLLQSPSDIPVLAPLVRREIYYRLLLSPQSHLLSRMTAEDGRIGRIAAGLEWLRRNAARPIRMEELAREMHMSPSTMHSWFRSVTGLSPLQFQKQLRLQEARRILLGEAVDVNAAARRVGYESPSQFTREYRRFFGAPPMRDIEQLRALGAPRRHGDSLTA